MRFMCRFPRKMFLNGREARQGKARCPYVRRFSIIVIGGFALLNQPYMATFDPFIPSYIENAKGLFINKFNKFFQVTKNN